jgi:hypothetical protein
MTVSELINKLQTFPPNADVIYQYHSDWSPLEEDEITLITAEESKRRVDASSSNYIVERAICFRGGRYCEAYSRANYPPSETPVYRDVVTFPGN